MHMQIGDCCDAPFPDCFGCPVLEMVIPSAWQMDFPAELVYSGARTTTCSTHDETITPVPFTDFETITVVDKSQTVELPDLSALGLPSILEVDSAEIVSPYGPVTYCIWASNEFLLWENMELPGLPYGTVGCADGVGATSQIGSETTGPDAWHYNYYLQTPPAFSLNRVRQNLTPNALCGTFTAECVRAWSCEFVPYGVWAILSVVTSGTSFLFRVVVYYSPRLHATMTTTQQSHNIVTDEYGPVNLTSSSDERGASFSPLGIPASGCLATLFPYASSANNLSQGLILRYEKLIDCDADFDGSPVVLDLVEEYKAYAGATQTKLESLGITGVSSTITITPIP